jgi:hypothetical protein
MTHPSTLSNILCNRLSGGGLLRRAEADHHGEVPGNQEHLYRTSRFLLQRDCRKAPGHQGGDDADRPGVNFFYSDATKSQWPALLTYYDNKC